VWAGPWPPALPAGPDGRPRPLVLYANHHYVHDGYLLWLLVVRALGRPALVWMEAWERAPLFAPLGALPFPPGDARTRARTIRATARRMAADPRTVLFLYPEGALGPPDAGLAPFRADLPRLAPLLPPETHWWPVGVHATWWAEARQTALLAAGPPHPAPDGREAERLAALLARLRAARPADLAAGHAHPLLDGRRGPEERWDLSRLAPLFRRWTR
jgi:1-acyl-sn-glycerol-3-phosphate acyltransferase